MGQTASGDMPYSKLYVDNCSLPGETTKSYILFYYSIIQDQFKTLLSWYPKNVIEPHVAPVETVNNFSDAQCLRMIYTAPRSIVTRHPTGHGGDTHGRTHCKYIGGGVAACTRSKSNTCKCSKAHAKVSRRGSRGLYLLFPFSCEGVTRIYLVRSR